MHTFGVKSFDVLKKITIARNISLNVWKNQPSCEYTMTSDSPSTLRVRWRGGRGAAPGGWTALWPTHPGSYTNQYTLENNVIIQGGKIFVCTKEHIFLFRIKWCMKTEFNTVFQSNKRL